LFPLAFLKHVFVLESKEVEHLWGCPTELLQLHSTVVLNRSTEKFLAAAPTAARLLTRLVRRRLHGKKPGYTLCLS
jgi:hypothetical protein